MFCDPHYIIIVKLLLNTILKHSLPKHDVECVMGRSCKYIRLSIT
jgi:hypothetical protein